MRRWFLFGVFAFLIVKTGAGSVAEPALFTADSLLVALPAAPEAYADPGDHAIDTISGRNTKITAIILAITLGPFGGHRIYLGTHHAVPVAYVLTLGGGLGILPLIDIVAILLTKDPSRYMNNRKFFMWAD